MGWLDRTEVFRSSTPIPDSGDDRYVECSNTLVVLDLLSSMGGGHTIKCGLSRPR